MEADVKAAGCRTSEEHFPIVASESIGSGEYKSAKSGKNGFLRVENCSNEATLADSTVPPGPKVGESDKQGASAASTPPDASERGIDQKLANLAVNDELEIRYEDYESEKQMPDITGLITLELSEPYSIYTYRYFLHNWPHLSYLAYAGPQCVGAVVCKLDFHQSNALRGYIAMLVVHKDYRRHKIGSSLVERAIQRMVQHGCDEIVLETEVTNKGALRLYENLGFVRDKRLLRYYLNGVDAWRLKLWLK